MNANCAYQIGKDHIVCEDYAMAGSDDTLTYAIVCDGCSASPDVDFGARIMAMAAKRNLLLGVDNEHIHFGKETVQHASNIFCMFPALHPQALDATLLVARIRNKKLLVEMWGDGVMVHKKKDSIVQVHIQLSSGAPDYLSYHLDKSRMDGYDDIEDNEKEITIFEDDAKSERKYAPFDPFIYDTDVEEGDVIALISDGINSFRKSDNTPIAWIDLVSEFTGFKNFEGQFALRRLAAFKRKCLKEGITHSDDISIGAIVV